MADKENRIAKLAATLKSSGMAKSDAQARMMAEEMVEVEDNVQKRYEDEHSKAHEFLKTAKNLGAPQKPKQPIQPIQVQMQQPKPQVHEPVMEQVMEQKQEQKPLPQNDWSQPRKDDYVDTTFGNKPINQVAKEHDTHNTFFEQMKENLQKNFHETPLEDMDPDKDVMAKGHNEVSESVKKSPEMDVEEPKSDVESVQSNTSSEQTDVQEQHEEEPLQQSKLDAERLVEMMEEDGKLEEHSREIKEKPKETKPKEDYVENTVDLSSMFNVNKK